ncbi:MAG: 30S ribosomal protein S8 [Candidatus Eremiobacteraeota bacterium]|nr:30S ribosomal protein S8 [Candidatus Eremiobacteraeota bacterium]
MAITDPIADMLTRIRNANTAYHEQVDVPASKMKEAIARVLKQEGFVRDFQIIKTGNQGIIRIFLRYGPGRERLITGIRRISRPGLRVYVGRSDIPRIFGGLGKVIMSTSKGIMTGAEARKKGVGGEVLCYIW